MERKVEVEQAVCDCGCACCAPEEATRELADESIRVPVTAVCSCGCECCAVPEESEPSKEARP